MRIDNETIIDAMCSELNHHIYEADLSHEYHYDILGEIQTLMMVNEKASAEHYLADYIDVLEGELADLDAEYFAEEIETIKTYLDELKEEK